MLLYEFSNDYLKLLDLSEEEELSEEAITDTMQMILDGGNDAAEGVGKLLKQLAADAEACKAEKLRLAKKQAMKERTAEKMREILKSWMQITNQKKIKTGLFTFSLATRKKLVLDVDEEAVPWEFAKVTVKPDTKKITEAMNKGDDIDWAHFEEAESLTVR
jgi:Siphovirus Gp157.